MDSQSGYVSFGLFGCSNAFRTILLPTFGVPVLSKDADFFRYPFTAARNIHEIRGNLGGGRKGGLAGEPEVREMLSI